MLALPHTEKRYGIHYSDRNDDSFEYKETENKKQGQSVRQTKEDSSKTKDKYASASSKARLKSKLKPDSERLLHKQVYDAEFVNVKHSDESESQNSNQSNEAKDNLKDKTTTKKPFSIHGFQVGTAGASKQNTRVRSAKPK